MNEPKDTQPNTVNFEPVRPTTSEHSSNLQASAGDAQPVNELTPEEQMALFEKDLKENDWGHQPC